MTTITGDSAASGSEVWLAVSQEPTYSIGKDIFRPEPATIDGYHASTFAVRSTAALAQDACDERLKGRRHGAVGEWEPGSFSVGTSGATGNVHSFRRAVEFDPNGSDVAMWQVVERHWVDLS